MSNIASLAQIPVVTDIAFNKTAFDNAGNTMHKWSQVNNKLAQEDREILGYQVVDAYSQMRVEEYVNFSKTFTPLMKWQVNWTEAVSPQNNDVCAQPENQAKATECLNNWMLAGFRDEQRAALE